MASYISSLPPLRAFFPPTPQAFNVLLNIYRCVLPYSIFQWFPETAKYQAQGKTSTISKFNIPGRLAWSLAELVGPLNLLFIVFSLPARLYPRLNESSSIIGTGLPVQHEIMAVLYVLHYANRAVITPWLLAPSLSPIHAFVMVSMIVFQYFNSAVLACWLVYDAQYHQLESVSTPSLFNLGSVIGISVFALGVYGNIIAENRLFSLRRAAAKRKAKSEGKAEITYNKVYVVPPAEGLFEYVMFPHYSLEWVEWIGYYILGGSWGMGWGTGWTTWARYSGALWFVVMELSVMTPRAVYGVDWYEKKFGKRAVEGRKAVIPGVL